MLARSTTLRHAGSGVELQTPLLIPSFSSKGFATSKGDGKSEIGKILAASGEFLTEAFLISAYDIHYKHIPDPIDLPHKPDLIFLDSGGYEISTDRDYASVVDPLPGPEHWDPGTWESVVKSWPDELPVVVVSYDHHAERSPFSKQIMTARERASRLPGHLHEFLLKPEKETQTTLNDALKAARTDARFLDGFAVIGLTEKELGKSMLDRMVQIARLRTAMDTADVSVPIHIFGALDPVSVGLYYIAGAEIFDGLTWIRYGYDDGRCLYLHNLGALRYGLQISDDAVRSRALAGNYYALQELQRRLRDFEATKKWNKLEPHGQYLEDAWDSLQTRL